MSDTCPTLDIRPNKQSHTLWNKLSCRYLSSPEIEPGIHGYCSQD